MMALLRRIFARPNQPEAPPKELAALGLAPGYHVKEMPPAQLDAFCRAWGVDANDDHEKRQIMACVVPSLKAVVLPPNATPEQKSHEFAHTWDVPHFEGGQGWDLAKSAKLQKPTQTATTKPKPKRIFGAR